MTQYTAAVAGATGLVGAQLVQQLLADPACTRLVVLVRRTTGHSHAKLTEVITDFAAGGAWQQALAGVQVLYSALGTTLAQAGSQQAQYAIDYTLQLEIARAARTQGAHTYVLVSSIGASAGSGVFYLRMKGELEAAVQQLGYTTVHIMQPGLLVGQRSQPRTVEVLGKYLLTALAVLPGLQNQHPIHGSAVAAAMRAAVAQQTTGVHIHTGSQLAKLAGGWGPL